MIALVQPPLGENNTERSFADVAAGWLAGEWTAVVLITLAARRQKLSSKACGLRVRPNDIILLRHRLTADRNAPNLR